LRCFRLVVLLGAFSLVTVENIMKIGSSFLYATDAGFPCRCFQ